MRFSEGVSCAVRLCDGPLSPVFPSSLTRLYRIQHVTASVGSCGIHAMATQCLVEDIPPASRRIVHAICRFLQSGSNIWRMTCFWWQLTHDITVHIIKLPFQKGCFEINVKNNSSEILVLWKQVNRSVGYPSACLGNLSVPIWPLP